MPEIACRAVAGDEGYVIAKRPKLLCDRIDQVLMITAREIGAADAALKDYIADNRQL